MLFSPRYVEQFIEILSEHGRKAIKITTKKPGEQPRVSYTRKPVPSAQSVPQPEVLSPKRIRLNPNPVNGKKEEKNHSFRL